MLIARSSRLLSPLRHQLSPSMRAPSMSFCSSSSSSRPQTGRSPEYRVLHPDRINPCVLEAEYAVRGAIPIRAEEIKHELQEGKELPFKSVVNCNIGNPQQLGQKPLTFLRQVSSGLL